MWSGLEMYRLLNELVQDDEFDRLGQILKTIGDQVLNNRMKIQIVAEPRQFYKTEQSLKKFLNTIPQVDNPRFLILFRDN